MNIAFQKAGARCFLSWVEILGDITQTLFDSSHLKSNAADLPNYSNATLHTIVARAVLMA
jgi:hypothetical protein